MIRAAVQGDGAFLGDMVVEAANWGPGGVRPRHEILASEQHKRYLSGWMRPGDRGFIATDATGHPIGAAWYRTLPPSAPGLGYVAAGVPELIIGVQPIWRAHGVGRALLQRLVAQARVDGHSLLSLSVQRGNYAATLYRSEGFAVTNSGHGRDVMVRRLH